MRLVSSGNVTLSQLELDFLKGGRVLALVKEVETRWNSTYAMIKRIRQLKTPLDEYRKILEDTKSRKLAEAAEEVRISSSDWETLS